MERIEDYLLIGDLQTAALVSKSGSIDWLCFPYFDSPSVFASLLDEKKGGRFSIDAPKYESIAKYRENTPIVETTFTSDDAIFSVSDFMLPRATEDVVPHFLVRKIKGIKGKNTVRLQFKPKPNYAKQQRILKRRMRNCICIRIRERSLWLHLPPGAIIEEHGVGGGLTIVLNVDENETKEITLEYSVESRLKLQGRDLEGETIHFWKEWVSRGRFFDFCKEELIRSAITMKLMQFYPTGGLIAAPTTSLPEEIGGERNWDYRFVWIRDATFTLYAFSILGYFEEADKFFRFVERIVEEAKEAEESESKEIEMALLYTIWGQLLGGEETLTHLSGYKNSKPVRIGNGASTQFQLDLYGSLIDAYYFAWKGGLTITAQGQSVILFLVDKIVRRWQEKDSGIWEVRSGIEHFAYSKVMAWVGIDRAIRLAEILQITDDQKKQWEATRQEIYDWIWKNCFDASRGTFTQHPNTSHQDATNFLFVLLHFLDRHEEGTKKMIEETKRELAQNELFVYRYLTDDGIKGHEGAFFLCTFWMIASLAAVGELDEAKRIFQEVRSLLPEHLLLSEEIDPKTKEYLGNYPQAFSHIGLVLAAYYIDRYSKKATEKISEPI